MLRVAMLATCLLVVGVVELCSPSSWAPDERGPWQDGSASGLHLLQAKAVRLVRSNVSLVEEEGLDLEMQAAGGHAGSASRSELVSGASAELRLGNATVQVPAAVPAAASGMRAGPAAAAPTAPASARMAVGPEGRRAEVGPRYVVPSKAVLVSLIRGSLFYMTSVLTIAVLFVMCNGRVEAPEEGALGRVPGRESGDTDSFHFNLCDSDGACGRDFEICLCAWLCGGIRWADTLSQRKLRFRVSFWFFLIFHVMAHGFSVLTMGISSGVFLVTAVYFRQRLRHAFGLKRGWRTVVRDTFTWICCIPCATVQEAREVAYFPLRTAG